MNTLSWVILTCGICWTGISVYLVLLARKQQVLTRRVNQLTALMESEE